MPVVTVQLSTCCDAKSLGEVAHQGSGEGGWGICSQCHDWSMFEVDTFDEFDEPEYHVPFTIPPTATDAQRLRTIGPQCDLSLIHI